jgi:hypothetical protein
MLISVARVLVSQAYQNIQSIKQRAKTTFFEDHKHISVTTLTKTTILPAK